MTRTPADNARTRAQVEDIARHIDKHGAHLTSGEADFVHKHLRWIKASPMPFWHPEQAAKIEQIWKAK